MRLCILLGFVALTVSMSAIDEQHSSPQLTQQQQQQQQQQQDNVNFSNSTLLQVDYEEEVESSTEELTEDDYLDDESEFLPDPEALTDGQEEEEEVVVLDDETRIVAEQLIQELDHIGNKLQDDEETVGTSRAISSAEVKKLERLLESAGLTPSSPLLRVMMQQRQDAIPASALGSGMDGMTGLGALLGGTAPLGAAGSSGSFLAPGSMTKKNVEEIKVELKHMLFGPENHNQRRRTGTAGRRPFATSQLGPYSDTGARQTVKSFSRYRPQSKVSKKRTRPISNRKAQNRQQPAGQQSKRPPIPLFLRPPRPARPGLNQQAKTVSSPPIIGGRPIQSDLARQPINEFRPPSSNFRLPEAPFRQQIATTNFAQPSRAAINNNANIPAAVRGQVSSPVEQRERFNPSQAIPRPTEDQFRPSLLNGNRQPIRTGTQTSIKFPSSSSGPARSTPSQTTVLGAQQRQPITNPQLPVKPQLGRPISAGNSSPPSNFAASVTLSTGNRAKTVQPECNLFSEGICLDVRNYPTELISNYLNRNKPALETMLAEVRSQSADDLVDGITSAEERRYSYNHYYGSRRQGEDTHAHRDFAEDGGFLCPSEVKYARPQLAQTSRGVWKYIINMAEHTQTIRMERCLKAKSGCSYVSPHYKSHCIQVYNYHRLLSFEESKGMHVDIYKIPVGCSCHVQGYAYLYPPLDGKVAGHIIPPAFPTEVSAGGGNTLGPNRKTSASSREQPTTSLAPSREIERPESRDEPFIPENFNVPSGMKEFSSFMDQQFGGHFGPFNSKTGSSRRKDDYGIDERDQQPMESNQENNNGRRRPASKTNYDYHPIIDFFHDKP